MKAIKSKQFSELAKETLYSSLTVDQNSNRMGYRLSGESVHSPDISLLSEGIALGAIQVPQDGQPYCSA
ncbi:biotin-dependent carboxyltransferase family protein [Vibrio chagasii]|nr:biotin-dependent carboxyltransferase family protein [Vibrio chagasii]